MVIDVEYVPTPYTKVYKKKSVVPILLPVPLFKAFALPGIVERATRRGPREYVAPDNAELHTESTSPYKCDTYP